MIVTAHDLAPGNEADRVITLEDGRIASEERGCSRADGKAAAPLGGEGDVRQAAWPVARPLTGGG